jgi:hypothetical protein
MGCLGATQWITRPPKCCFRNRLVNLTASKDYARRFFYVPFRWVGYLVSELRASPQTSGGTMVAV